MSNVVSFVAYMLFFLGRARINYLILKLNHNSDQKRIKKGVLLTGALMLVLVPNKLLQINVGYPPRPPQSLIIFVMSTATGQTRTPTHTHRSLLAHTKFIRGTYHWVRCHFFKNGPRGLGHTVAGIYIVYLIGPTCVRCR